jgi:hypothetical protein
MKNFQKFKSITMVMLISGLLIFTLSFNVEAQNSSKNEGKKGVVVLKIKKDDNGKSTVVDTTFTISTPGGKEELEKYLKKHEVELEDLDEELDNIEVFVDMSDFPDSIATDSVLKKVRIISRDIRSPHFKWHNREDGFDYSYDFDIPCPPDIPPPPFPGCEGFEREFLPGHDMRVFRYDHKRQTLSDIIGDIPMDRVKSYSIKDRKNGKRIIIDIDDAPLRENQDRVIIIRDRGKQPSRKDNNDRQMKVIINSDDDKQIEK